MMKRRTTWINWEEAEGSAGIPGRALAEVSRCVVITSYWLYQWQLKTTILTPQTTKQKPHWQRTLSRLISSVFA